jgi:hypothetical protein
MSRQETVELMVTGHCKVKKTTRTELKENIRLNRDKGTQKARANRVEGMK